MNNSVKFLTIVLVLTINPIITGFLIMKLWMWFIVPTFDTTPLRLVEAIGLMLLINVFKPLYSPKKEKDTYEFWLNLLKSIGLLFCYSGFILFFGWIISLFM